MAAIDTHRAQGFGATAHIASIFASAKARYSDWRDTRATVSVLSKLSDHELEDIGLCRGDIRDMLR